MSTDVSRRTVVAGTAWAVPAIVVAAAAPAVAASDPGGGGRCVYNLAVVLQDGTCRIRSSDGDFTGYRVTLTINRTMGCGTGAATIMAQVARGPGADPQTTTISFAAGAQTSNPFSVTFTTPDVVTSGRVEIVNNLRNLPFSLPDSAQNACANGVAAA